jgi:hypothetical protein
MRLLGRCLAFLCMVAASHFLSAQTVKTAQAQTQGTPLNTVSEVSTSVTVDAVLLPYNTAKRAFGKEIAHNYAVVSLTISNRDPKQSLIVQSTLLDYSHWLFSGSFAALSGTNAVTADTWQQQNKMSQVASAEVRVVRGQMQDAQLWSLRNWVIRSAVAVGSVAAGLSFVSSNSLFANSVSVYSSDFVPALGVLWPDTTQAHSDLISDIGFRTNHVVPAQSSDIVIAFFPLDRFLTPALKKIYFEAPAAFFNPSEMLLDTKERGELLKPLAASGFISGSTEDEQAKHLTTAIKDFESAAAVLKAKNPNSTDPSVLNPCVQASLPSPLAPDDCTIVDLLNRVSLNTIRVVVGGIMTVDTALVPATISAVTISADTQSSTWASDSKVSGIVAGAFLSGANITVTDSTGAAIGTIAPVTANATDASLPFTLTLSTTVATASKLSFVVTKKAKDGSTNSSAPFSYTVPPPAAAPATTAAPQ